MIAGIELGGTKIVVAVGDDDGTLIEQHCVPTREPEKSLQEIVEWLNEKGDFRALGVASFGPIGVDQNRFDYGCLLCTPKVEWARFPLIGKLKEKFPDTLITFDTDVNAAAIAESRVGAAKGHDHMAYITVGTGIGAGFVRNGEILSGVHHSEFGHLTVPRHPADDFFGTCDVHRDCLEGLASGPAMEERWKCPAHELPSDHLAWEMESWYLAYGAIAIMAILAPTIIVIGGGVSQANRFHFFVEDSLQDLANGYFPSMDHDNEIIVPPALGQDAGIQGALLLAAESI